MFFYNWGMNFNNCFAPRCYCNNNIFAQVFQYGILSRMMNMFMPQRQIFPFYPQYNQNIFNSFSNYPLFFNPYRAVNNANLFEIFNNSYRTTYPNISDYTDKDFLNNEISISRKSTKTNNKAEVSKTYENPANAKKLGKPFLNKVKQVAKNINCDYKDLLALMNSESALDPKANNGSYVGLIQFGNAAVQDLRTKGGCSGLTKEKILKMSAVEQLDLVEKYIQIAKKYGGFSDRAKLSAGDLYAIIFAPGKAGNEVLYKKGESGYNSVNSKLDYNKDGRITKSEMAQRINKKRVNESIFA